MGFNYGGIGDFKSGYFCGFLPNADELRHEFNIRSRTNKQSKKENIEDKVEEQGIIKEPHIPILHSIEIKIQNYRW